MNTQVKKYTRISGLSEARRLPRLGKIRLGIKKKAASGAEYPSEVPWFVCPPEVQAVYGAQPTALDVMIPIEDETIFFPQAYKFYAASHLRCRGDGQTAMRRAGDLDAAQRAALNGDIPKDNNALVEVTCPCPMLEAGKCKQVGNLMLLLPRVSMGGVYQVDTGSIHNIININSAIDYTRALMGGRIALVPLTLRRTPQAIEYKGKRATHYLLSLQFTGSIPEINQMRQNSALIVESVSRLELPAPETPALVQVPLKEAGEDGEPLVDESPIDEFPEETPQVPAQNGERIVSEKQAIRFRAIAGNSGRTHEECREYLASLGISSSKLIPVRLYEQVCGWAGNIGGRAA